MATIAHPPRAGIEELYAVDGKAELVDGALHLMPPTGLMPGRASRAVVRSLERYARTHGGGEPIGDNVGFVVDLSRRQSFSPDAAWWTGEDAGMSFCEGAPVFAVEVRSEHDYGPSAERAMARKRADYFAAGTHVVWDVDLDGTDVVTVYRTSAPPRGYKRGEMAEAEPAVPGWRMAVDELFER